VHIGHVGDAEIDNLYRVIFHHENIARLQVTVHKAALVRRLQSPAHLRHYSGRALRGQAMTRCANQSVESGARQQGHDKVRLLLAVFVKLSNVEDLDDI
jgi:hypothetical protein